MVDKSRTSTESSLSSLKPLRSMAVLFAFSLTVGVSIGATYHVAHYLWTKDLRPQIVGSRLIADGTTEIELLSPRYDLTEVFISMEGPYSNHAEIPVSTKSDLRREVSNAKYQQEILYVTGVQTELIDAGSGDAVSPEFFCHSNLTLSPSRMTPERHNQLFTTEKHLNWRLITLVPGKMGIRLPEGFGIPVGQDETLDYLTMALNQNPGLPPRSIQMKTHLYTSTKTLKPLFMRSLTIYQRHVDDSEIDTLPELALYLRQHPGELCAESCKESMLGDVPSAFETVSANGKLPWHPGLNCCVQTASAGGIVPQTYGKDHTIHWMVPPGKHRYRSEVSQKLDLPFDTTAHFVTGHLHPMGVSLKLIEMDSQETVFEITGTSRQDRLGVLEMSEMSLPEGVRLERDKRYELIAEYNNTRDEPIDAMGIMYVYLLDEPPSTAREELK